MKALRSMRAKTVIELPPGYAQPLFKIEAKLFPFGERKRVLALAWPQ